jgi:hypothetical protein
VLPVSDITRKQQRRRRRRQAPSHGDVESRSRQNAWVTRHDILDTAT